MKALNPSLSWLARLQLILSPVTITPVTAFMKRTLHATIFDRAELERLRGRVGRLFVALQEASEMVAGEAGAWLPPVDLCESGDCVTVRVELPGVRAEQIEVALTNEHLRVRGRKRKGAPRGVI